MPLVPDGAVRINNAEARRLGVADGSRVRLSSKRASVETKVKIDDRVARGMAAVAHNVAGLDARSLVEIDEVITEIRIETL